MDIEIKFMAGKIEQYLQDKQGLDVDFLRTILIVEEEDMSELESEKILKPVFSINKLNANDEKNKNSKEYNERYSLLVRTIYICIKYEIPFLQSVKTRYVFVTNQILMQNIKERKKKESINMVDYVNEIYKETKDYSKYFMEYATKYDNKIKRLDKLYEIIKYYTDENIISKTNSLISIMYPYHKQKKVHLEVFG